MKPEQTLLFQTPDPVPGPYSPTAEELSVIAAQCSAQEWTTLRTNAAFFDAVMVSQLRAASVASAILGRNIEPKISDRQNAG